MKKSIANKIERLLKTLATSPSPVKVINSIYARKIAEKKADEPDNLHYELNPEKPCITRLPRRLLQLLRPWSKAPEFQIK